MTEESLLTKLKNGVKKPNLLDVCGFGIVIGFETVILEFYTLIKFPDIKPLIPNILPSGSLETVVILGSLLLWIPGAFVFWKTLKMREQIKAWELRDKNE